MVEELSFFKVTNRQARLINQLPEEQFVGESTQRITQDQLAARSLRELERSGTIQVKHRQSQIVDQKNTSRMGRVPL